MPREITKPFKFNGCSPTSLNEARTLPPASLNLTPSSNCTLNSRHPPVQPRPFKSLKRSIGKKSAVPDASEPSGSSSRGRLHQKMFSIYYARQNTNSLSVSVLQTNSTPFPGYFICRAHRQVRCMLLDFRTMFFYLILSYPSQMEVCFCY